MRYDTFAFVAATVALAAAALFAGCNAQPFAETSQAEGVPTLSFNADWSVTRSGTLVGGAPAAIHYAIERLPECRTIYHGGPAWGITADWAADGGFARSTAVVQYQGGVNQPIDAPIVVPFGHDLALWFHNSDVGGCSRYDSNYGKNFHFPIQAPAEPVIHFAADWSQRVDGNLVAGADFLVDYDLLRASQCRAQYNGYQTWEITAHVRFIDSFGDGSTQDQPVTRVVGLNGRDATAARFHAPAGSSSLELWFENSDRSGCHAWDSNYGSNYRFTF